LGRAHAQNVDNKVPLTQVSTKLLYNDSLLFHSIFYSCDFRQIENLLAPEFEFYQEKGDLRPAMVSMRGQFIENLKKNFCEGKGPKMRRDILKETMQTSLASPIIAIQTGVQRFYITPNGEEEKMVETSKFYRVWKLVNGIWKLANESDRMINNGENELQTGVANKTYQPVDKVLYNKIAQLDSILFDAYNNCKMNVSEELYSDSIEFYHDRGGLSTSKKGLLESLKNNICGKVTRHLVPGSIEVSPIPGYGAVEIGEHSFHNNQEPDAPSKPSRFVVLWQYKNDKWQVREVISLH
jgi:hypothetical protein